MLHPKHGQQAERNKNSHREKCYCALPTMEITLAVIAPSAGMGRRTLQLVCMGLAGKVNKCEGLLVA